MHPTMPGQDSGVGYEPLMHSTNTIRTTIGARAVPLAALAALLVVLASADAAMRASAPGVREVLEGRTLPRTSVVGFGRLVEGLLACTTVPDAGVPVMPAARPTAPAHRPTWSPAIVAVFGLSHLLDLPPPVMG